MLEDEGHWLKLMSVAAIPADANICLQISGSDVLCTVTSDIAREVELRVTCRIGDQGIKDSNWTAISSCSSTSVSEDTEKLKRYSPRFDEGGKSESGDHLHSVVDIKESPNEMLDLPDSASNTFYEEGDLGGGDDVAVDMPRECSPIGSSTCKSEPTSDDNNSSLQEGYCCKEREVTKDRNSTDAACGLVEEKAPSTENLEVPPLSGEQDRVICRGVESAGETLRTKRTTDDDDRHHRKETDEETDCPLFDDKDCHIYDDVNTARKCSSGRCFQCPHCPYFSYRHYVYARHLKTHSSVSNISSSSGAEISATSSNAATLMDRYCRACNIQFMSVKTYQVHKQFYCNSRHELSRSPTEMDSLMHLGDSNNSTDGIISPSNSSNAAVSMKATLPTGTTPLLQPQAIFAAISTNPLILLPCSVINGQVVVPQNGIIPSGTGLVVPTPLSGTNAVSNSSMAHLLRQVETSVVPDGVSNVFKNDSIVSQSLTSLPAAHSSKPVLPSSMKEPFRDSDGPCRQKSHCVINTSNDVFTHTKKTKVESKSHDEECFVTSQQNVPLDLSVRKRKISSPCVQPPVNVMNRRHSSASSSTSSPPVSSYSHVPSSPGAYGMDRHSSSSSCQSARTTSPVLPHSDGSSSSVVCPTTKASSVPGRSSPCGSNSQGTGSVVDRVSPHPPVLHSGVEAPGISHRFMHISAPPPKVMKHGNNVCKECNIVFYKYDNYLAHKKHYCAYRRHQVASNATISHADSIMNSEDGNKSGETNEIAFSLRNSAADENPRTIPGGRPVGRLEFGMELPPNPTISAASVNATKTHVPVYRCDVCGVKFSTLDNLNAHQTYYCSRQGEINMPKPSGRASPSKKCRRARDIPGPSYDDVSQESLELPDEWKCNYCEVVCPSLKTARRHLLTHTEIKGFCCIICGYRGNTLRGMRNHIYGHLSVDNGQIEDLLASSVVVDPSSSAVHSQSSDYSDEESYSIRRDGKTSSPLGRIESYRDTTHRSKSSVSPVPLALESAAKRQQSETQQQFQSSESPEIHIFGCQFCDFSSSDQETTADHVSSHHEKTVQDSERETYCQGDVSYNGMGGECSEIINASSVCDVVIKAEDEPEERIVPDREYDESSSGCPVEGHLSARIKEEPLEKDECEIRREEKNPITGASPTSVICKTRVSVQRENTDSSEGLSQEGHLSDEFSHESASKGRQERCVPKSELKYCKSCDISFHHLSNFIAHKKYYCVPRVVRNFQQETAPVQ